MTCIHLVVNTIQYEQSLQALFPLLFRSIRQAKSEHLILADAAVNWEVLLQNQAIRKPTADFFPAPPDNGFYLSQDVEERLLNGAAWLLRAAVRRGNWAIYKKWGLCYTKKSKNMKEG